MYSRGELHLSVDILKALVDGDVLVLALVHQRFLLVHVSLLQVGEALQTLVQLLLFRQTLPRDRCNQFYMRHYVSRFCAITRYTHASKFYIILLMRFPSKLGFSTCINTKFW